MSSRLFRPGLTLALLVVLASLLLSGCQVAAPVPSAATPDEAAGGGTLRIGLATEPVSLDPAAGLYIAEQFVLMNIFDPLIWADQDNNLHPGLAVAWESNDAGTEFTLNLRDGVTFHDGTPFNAEAVKAQFDRITSMEAGAATAPEILAGYAGSTVVDPLTITVAFDIPKPTFITDLSRIWMAIPSPSAVEEWGADFGQHPVGTGPFVFSDWAAQERLTLTRNPDYAWGPEFASHSGPSLLDEVVFRFLPEAATRLSAFQTGELHVVEEPSYQDAVELANSPDYRLLTFPAPGMPSHMMINTELPPTDDIRVRQAMIHAVNQEELVQTAFQGLQTPVHNVLAPTTWSYNEEAASLYRYDPERARQLLEEAGWVDNDGNGIREKDGQELQLVYPALPAYEEAYMELLAAYLNQVGFRVDISLMDDAGIFEFGNAGRHNILNMGWISRSPAVLDIVYNSANIEQGSAFTRFRSDELDQALNEAAVTLDPDQREELYQRVQQIIMENALIIPLYAYDRVMLMRAEVQGWQFDPEGFPWLYEVSLGG